MGLGVGFLLAAVGAVLAFAVNATVSGVNIHAVGWILLIVGNRRRRALDDLLVVVGGAGLLVVDAPAHDGRRRGAAAVLEEAREAIRGGVRALAAAVIASLWLPAGWTFSSVQPAGNALRGPS